MADFNFKPTLFTKMTPNFWPTVTWWIGNFIWLQLILGQKPCFLGPVQLVRQKVNIHYPSIWDLRVHTILKIQNMYLLCSFECVVCVHDGMDQVIHSNKPPGSGSVFRIWIPTIQQYCNMVIPEKNKNKNTVFLLFFPFFFINSQSKGDFCPQACIRGLGNKFPWRLYDNWLTMTKTKTNLHAHEAAHSCP